MGKSNPEIFKEHSTTELRTCSPYHHIDPGFINRRKIMSIFGDPFIRAYEKARCQGEDHLSLLRNDHLMVQMCTAICKHTGVKSLQQALIEGPGIGQLIFSTNELEGNPSVWNEKRCSNRILLPFEFEKEVVIEYSTQHLFSDTTTGELSEGTINSVLGEIRSIDEIRIVIHPLIIGAPTYDHPVNGDLIEKLYFNGWEQYQVFPEDIKEFSKISEIEVNDPNVWIEAMKTLPESQVKEKIAEILGDTTKKDWGGEQNDHYSSGITLGNKRVTAAFLLKGPAKFEEMQPRHLGKNADQIYRLQACPADLLIVQHCHNIGEAVRATLRAFAVTPHNPRYYCCLDGKDTYKLLKAYEKI
jgi:hypothetical protein